MMSWDNDATMGMYHYLRPTVADLSLENYVSPVGAPMYRLGSDKPVTFAILAGQDSTQSFSLFIDVHLESDVAMAQSYGDSRPPTMTNAEFSRLCELIARWPTFTENPTHVIEFLQKMGRGAWKAFKWAAPHMIRAATAAAAGATPAGALAAALVPAMSQLMQ